MSGETFTCARCGGTFSKDWSDEEAMAEARSLMPAAHLADGGARVCDDCFIHLMSRAQVEAPELLVPGAPLVPGACYRTAGGQPVHYRGCRCPR